ncbi:glycosyltransferase family 8 C-terminal domain-containing protein [Providencia vermicola]|uniref:glycosyltransferase family 8 C-terminal domain-containing protein n=1 Tax=Providencia vermicola TaxID=333965 RepID=UPI0034DD57F3
MNGLFSIKSISFLILHDRIRLGRDLPLLKAENYKQLSRKKSHLRKNRKFFQFLLATVEYINKKIFH